MSLSLRYAARSHVGLIRDGNEDSGYASARLLVIADGMGGQAAGEIASAVAVETLAELDSPHTTGLTGDPVRDLDDRVKLANTKIRSIIAQQPELEGMGTTVTALFLAGGSHFAFAHIGDSRAYRLRGGVLEQISTDHTWVQRLIDEGQITPDEAERHPQRSLLMRALGTTSEVDLDLTVLDVQAGDRYLLCSDGLSGFVPFNTLASTLAGYGDPHHAAETLIQHALRGGGADNITCIVADAYEQPAPGSRPPSQAETQYLELPVVVVGKPRRTVIAGVTVVVLAATGGVALAAANNSPTPTPGAPGAAMMHGRGGPLHGVFTVSDGKGGYQTELMQNGTVQSFSGGTLTVKSADGYTHSYTTDSTTMFGRGGHGGHGMRGGNWGRGPMHGRFGTMPNGTAMPNGAAAPDATMPNTGAPTASGTATAPNALLPQANTAVPNTAAAAPATATTPNLTVGENVMVIAIQSGGTDHAQRVTPMRTPNQNGRQNNGQNGNGGFFGRHRGFGGMTGGQMGGAPMGNAPMGSGQPGNGPMGTAPGQPGNGPVNLPNGAPATSSSPATTPQSSAGATAQSTGPAATTNG